MCLAEPDEFYGRTVGPLTEKKVAAHRGDTGRDRVVRHGDAGGDVTSTLPAAHHLLMTRGVIRKTAGVRCDVGESHTHGGLVTERQHDAAGGQVDPHRRVVTDGTRRQQVAAGERDRDGHGRLVLELHHRDSTGIGDAVDALDDVALSHAHARLDDRVARVPLLAHGGFAGR